MAKNCFDNTPHESLDCCPNEEISAGVSTRLFYAPAEFVEKCVLPEASGNYENRLTITDGNLTLKTDKAWKGIDIQMDEGELKNTLVGNIGNKKAKAELEIKIPGFRPKAVGFVDTYKNVPMVLVVIDSSGVFWVLGTKINPAYMESADGTTGKKAEDDSGISVKITANTKLYKYAGSITEA